MSFGFHLSGLCTRRLPLAELRRGHLGSSPPASATRQLRNAGAPVQHLLTPAATSLLHPPICRGYDVDAWRAHLNALTWPEVARQLGTAAGLGRRRFKPQRGERAKMGQEGEDVVAEEDGGGECSLRFSVGTRSSQVGARVGAGGGRGRRPDAQSAQRHRTRRRQALTRPPDPPPRRAGDLRLRLPSRLGIGTVKAAAWQARSGLGCVRWQF